MAGSNVCETRWTKILESFERHHNALVTAIPDVKEEIGLVHAAQQLIPTSLMAN
jgi:hypothetical protein